jgi:HK97 family phage major capsid protein
MNNTQRLIETMQDDVHATSEKMRDIEHKAITEDRELSRGEQKVMKHHQERVESLKQRIGELDTKLKNDQHVLGELDATIGGIGMLPGQVTAGRGAGQPFAKAHRAHAWGEAVIAVNGGVGMKALLPNGGAVVTIPAPPPVELGRPVTSLRSVIPWEPTTGMFTYLRQTARTNNAAPVAAGDVKPTSVYSLERIEDRARTIAHRSEPINNVDLADAPSLEQFIADEMAYGLERALEAQIIGGDGTDENLTGLAHISGIQTQAAPGVGDDRFTVIRKGLTKLELQGLDGAGTAIVMHPSDWEAFELARTTTGEFFGTHAGQALPVDGSARRLFGKPVVVTIAATVGTAYVADFVGSTKLFVREEAVLSWFDSHYDSVADATDWARNLTRFRVEGRFGFAVTRPIGVVKVTLA